MYMYQHFFIHSSVDGHLGCFQVLAIVNSAAMDSGVHVSFSIMVSSGYMPSSGSIGSYDKFYSSAFKDLYLQNKCFCALLPLTVQTKSIHFAK